jgi:RHS repeat-associated protein
MTSMSEPSTDGTARTTINKYDDEGRVTDQWDPKATAAASGSPTSSATATHFDYSTPDTTVITDPDGRVHTQVFQDGYTISDTVGTGTDAATTSFAYDPVTSGGASVTDPSGNTSYTEYTPQGWTSSTTDAAGNTTTYDGYDTFGNPGTVTANNVTTTYTYDSHGNPESTSTPWDTHPGVSKGSTYTYNDPSLPADASNDPAHPGDVRVIQAPDGTETHIDYDPNTGLVTRVEDAAHGVTTYGYDAAGDQTWVVSANGNQTGGNPFAHRQVSLVNPAGETIASLDANGKAVADGFVRASSASLGVADTGESWTALSGTWNLTGHKATVAGLGAGGRAVAMLATHGAAAGMSATMVIADPTATGPGLAFRVKDNDNYWALWQVPGYGGLVLSKNVAGTWTNLAGFATSLHVGDRLSVGEAFSGGMLFYVNNQLIGSAASGDLATETGIGLVSLATGPVTSGIIGGSTEGGSTQVWYNAAGQPVTTVGPTKNGPFVLAQSTQTYDLNGRPDTTTDGNQHQTKTGWSPAGKMISQTDGNNQVTNYGYDALGRLAWSQNPSQSSSNRPTYSYTWGDASTSTPATVTEAYPTSSGTHPTATTTLDADGRPTLVDYSDTTPDVTIHYDLLGRADQESAGGVAVVKHWDSLGQLTDVTRAGRQVSYTYDEPGQIHQITYPGSHVVTESYDTARRWSGVADWAGGGATYGYDADGNVTSVTTPGGVVDTRVLDGNDNPTGITVKKGTSTVASWGYTRNPDTNLAGVTATGVGTSTSWGYDAASQLTSQTAGPAQTYAYDPAGNPTTLAGRAQVFNTANQLCWTAPTAGAGTNPTCASPPTGSTSYGYNANGDRTSAGSNTYTWNLADQLVAASTGAGTSSYTYDPSGRCVNKTVGGVSTDFTWDDTAGIPELIGDGTNYFLYGPDGLPVERIGADPTIYLHQDATGSVRLTTKTDGTTNSTTNYTPWGVVTASTGTPPALGYNSQYTDPETGYIYLRARYYDPNTAQFVSCDPLVIVTGASYNYSANSPLMNDDPLGLVCGSILDPNYNPECLTIHGYAENCTGRECAATCGGIVGNAEGNECSFSTSSLEQQSWEQRAGCTRMDVLPCHADCMFTSCPSINEVPPCFGGDKQKRTNPHPGSICIRGQEDCNIPVIQNGRACISGGATNGAGAFTESDGDPFAGMFGFLVGCVGSIAATPN